MAKKVSGIDVLALLGRSPVPVSVLSLVEDTLHDFAPSTKEVLIGVSATIRIRINAARRTFPGILAHAPIRYCRGGTRCRCVGVRPPVTNGSCE